MTPNLSRYKSDLERLVSTGKLMFADITYRHLVTQRKLNQQEQESAQKVEGNFESKYQRWYTESLALITQLAHDRRSEFESLYAGQNLKASIKATANAATLMEQITAFRIG